MDMCAQVIVHAYVVMLGLGSLEEVYNIRFSSTGIHTTRSSYSYDDIIKAADSHHYV